MMKILAAALACLLTITSHATTVRFSAVCEDGYPESKSYVMKGRSATETLSVLNEPIITEADIQSARVAADSGGNAIILTLTPSGVGKLNQGIHDMQDKRLGILIDDVLVSAPVLRNTTFGSLVQISGNFTPGQAAGIVESLNRH